jgi:hypothetical protein
LKPERWGSLLVQENNREEKACGKRRIIIIIIINKNVQYTGLNVKYSITPLIRINWEGDPTGYTKHPDN